MILLKKFNVDLEAIFTVILVVTYNSEQYIDDLIESIAHQDYDANKVLLLVIDNNSRDRTVDKIIDKVSQLESKIKNVLLIRLSRNVGFAPANNLGLRLLRLLRGSLSNTKIILLNPDTKVLDKRFLAVADKLLSRLPIVGFAMLSGDGIDIVDSIGAYVDALGNSQDILCGVKLSRIIKTLIDKLPSIYAVPSACFAAIAIRGEVFESLGLLKDFYVIYFEDTEFCLRAWSRGVPIHVYRDFMVWHVRGGTQKSGTVTLNSKIGGMRRGSLEIPYHFSKNSLLLSYEYLGPLTFLLRTLLYLIASLTLKRKHLVYSFLESIHIIWRKRLKWRRLPKDLIPRSPRTWVLLWALKYLLRYGSDVNTAINYGVRRASIECIPHLLIPRR